MNDLPRRVASGITASKDDINLNPDGTFMDADQILADLPQRIKDPQGRAYIRSGFTPPPGSTPDVCYTYGRMATQFSIWVRNSYGLWRHDNPHVTINAPVDPKTGNILDPKFPDNFCADIIRRFTESMR